MKKWVTGFLCGALFLSGIVFAASEFTANAGVNGLNPDGQEKGLADKPVSMEGESYLPVRELAGAMGDRVGIDNGIKLDANRENEKPGKRSAGNSDKKFEKLPITQTVNDVEVTIHSIRVTEKTTDFEVTIKNNTDKEKVTLNLKDVKTGANRGVEGKPYETVEVSSDNPDFKDKAIRPKKELHGWIRNQGLKDRDVANLSFSLSLKGAKEARTYHFFIDCKKLKFRTL